MSESRENRIMAEELFHSLLKNHGYKEEYIMSQIEYLFNSQDGFIDRYKFFLPLIDNSDKESLLVSGSAVGAELLIAKEMGFKKIIGVEVSDYYKETADILTKGSGVKTFLYDGNTLPFKDKSFSMAISGHVIEHTKDPKIYLKELSRVLKENSVLFIEFPDRNHRTELHTGTKSFERYPTFIRNSILTLLANHLSLSEEEKNKYRSVRDTLKQISEKDINNVFKNLRIKYSTIHKSNPVPGIVRLLYRIN